MPQLNRLFGVGRRPRFAVILSLMLLIMVGGSLWLTARPTRARVQEQEETARPTAEQTPLVTVTPPTSDFPSQEAAPSAATRDAGASPQSRPHQRNLSLQTEAVRLTRALGRRYHAPTGREVTSLNGTLTFGSEQHAVQITRRQDNDGESVGITLDGRATFTWSYGEGAKAGGGASLTGVQRSFVERLVHDSPDYFVLAQLRGARYYTVVRQARPAGAGGDDDYSGPTWDIVSVREPARRGVDGSGRQPAVRLYYLNTKTNLIDKVITREEGEAGTSSAVVAEVMKWAEQGGERVPEHIIWRRGAEVLMEYRQMSFAHTTDRQ